MKTVRMGLFNETKGVFLAERLGFVLRHNERRRGLTGMTGICCEEAYVFPRCRQIHTFGMLFSIDVVFLDRSSSATRIYRDLEPRKLTGVVWKGTAAIELQAGICTKTGTEAGDLLKFIGESGEYYSCGLRYIQWGK
ncbi:MAG: DUF192 domain-containing protein [Actinobacteria bacterium]|nr:DUF192 domain-containing protein [Actinomycetota bacterium]